MNSIEDRILDLFEAIHPLDRIARAGYVLRGVTEPESVAAHSHFVAVMTLLIVDAHPGRFDREKAVAMALLHDLPECRLMDIPMPACKGALGAAKAEAELAVGAELLGALSARYVELLEELEAAQSPEARLVRGIDKLQMMAKIVMYQREGRGRLEEFWANPANFNDYDVPEIAALFDALCARAGRTKPGA